MKQTMVAIFGAQLALSAASSSHPNELKFEGTLVRLDEPSTKAPNGSRGHRILIPKVLAQKKLKTLIGMGVNYSDELNKHAPTKKVGVIKAAWIEGNAIKVSGVIWKKDFPDAAEVMKKKDLGMSFEASDISVEDIKANIWSLSDLCFTGAAILYKTAAAYYKTEALAASAMSVKLITTNDGGNLMKTQGKGSKQNKKPAIAASGSKGEDLVAVMTKAMKPVVDSINSLVASQSRLQASIEAGQADQIAEKARIAAAEGDEDEDEDVSASEDEENVDASEDEEDLDAAEDEEEVEAAGKKKPKGGRFTKADDDDADDEEASSANDDADDADDLEDLDDPDIDDCDEPGTMNKDIKNKGSKTNVSTNKEKHKTVSASSLRRIESQVDKLIAARQEDKKRIKELTNKLKANKEQIAAAAEAVGRRSHVVVSPMLKGLLSKEHISVDTLAASGETMPVSELDAILDKGNLSIQQRIAIKAEAARAGVIEDQVQ